MGTSGRILLVLLVPRSVFGRGRKLPPERGFRVNMALYLRYLIRHWALFPCRYALAEPFWAPRSGGLSRFKGALKRCSKYTAAG